VNPGPIFAVILLVTATVTTVFLWRVMTNPLGTVVSEVENASTQDESRGIIGQMPWLWAVAGVGLLVGILVVFILILHYREQGWWWQ
jgi:hypothetical protein